MRRRRTDRGAVSASVAVVPAVVGLFFFAVQVSLWFYARMVATAAAEHGLDAARVYQGPDGGADLAAGRQTVDEFIEQVDGVESYTVSVQQTGGAVVLTIHAQPVNVLPFFDHTVDVTVEAPLEDLPD